MITHTFNATLEIEKIRQLKRITRRKHYHRSRLIKFRSELVQLKKAGAIYKEITLWLRKTKRVKMAHTSVMRFLKKCPELKENNHA